MWNSGKLLAKERSSVLRRIHSFPSPNHCAGFDLTGKRAGAILDVSDVKGLIRYGVKNERDRLMLSLMYGCGLRVSEVINLTWDDFKPHGEGGKATVFGKGSKTRVVLIPDKLWRAVKEFEKYHRVNQYVFVSRNDNKMDRSVVHRMIKRACKRAGIDERASAHWLRHSHASHSL